jgi:hypothetical protein
MCKYSKAEKRVAECSTIPESVPEAMMKYDKGVTLKVRKEMFGKLTQVRRRLCPK